MNLDHLAVRARLRSPWESVDLGIALARRQWGALFLVWLLPAALVFGACAALLWQSPGLAMLLLWWLKPAYDRLPLFIASRALFGERVGAGAALRQFLAQNRRDWFAWLTWRRLSATRSFDMPVTLLEQNSGAARSSRVAVLHRKHAGAATWLTLTLVHIELILALAVMALIYLFIPEQLQIDWLPFLSSGALWMEWALNGIYLLVMAAVAPFYVVGGFALYIGRRIELEGWDIEIQFRKLRARHGRSERGKARGAVAAQLLLLCALGLSGLLHGGPARAEAAATPEQARETVDQVLVGEDFHRMETVKRWRLKDFEWKADAFPNWMIEFIEWLERLLADDDADDSDFATGLGPLIGTLIELLLWIAVIGLLVHLLWRYREPLRQSLQFRRRAAPDRRAPETLFGLDVRRSSLPDDVCAEVLRLWASGDRRNSLGLLYRATLSHLIERYQFEFGDHLTESECARQVQTRRQREADPDGELRPVSGALGDFVQQLTGVWQQLAYAHRAPATGRVENLCDRWREVFADDR
ncbi:DUF4129 domain-containing protein [Microbulbifer litoralis]|uniref:DUF4129 domain-containing protein n=1 Tax=Microbulbifer litoralis TaxID=2933965 RepID=UPI0020299192